VSYSTLDREQNQDYSPSERRPKLQSCSLPCTYTRRPKLSSTPRLSLGFGFLFLLHLRLLFLFLVLLLILSLQTLNLLLGLWNWLEKSLQSCLLTRLQVLRQPSSTTSYSVLTKSLLSNQELDKTFDVGSLPFKVAVRMISRMDIGVKKKFSSIGIRPVFREGVFRFLIVLDPVNKVLKCAMLANELKGCVRTNFGNWI